MMWFGIALLGLLGCGSAQEAEHDDHEHAEESGHRETVTLSETAMRSARIVVTEASIGALEQRLTVPARITLAPRREALLSVWMEGQIDAIRVPPGETVRAGQILATVQSPELGEAIAAFRAASARDTAADLRLERLKRLEDAGVAAHAQVLEAEADHAAAEGALEAAEERLRILGVDPTVGDPNAGEHYVSHIPIRSPISGKLLSADASVGERVEPGQTLFHIGDLDEVWLMLDVYERNLASVQVGQSVWFTVEAWPGETFEGRVEQVGDWIEPDARTIEVRVIVANEEHRLKPNMFAQASLSTNTGDRVIGIILPLDAVQRLDGEDVVFVQEQPGRFASRVVQVTARSADQALVSEGLSVGEQVVTVGAFTLKSELEKSELGEGHAH